MATDFPQTGDKLFGLDGEVNINLNFMRRFHSERAWIDSYFEMANGAAERFQADDLALSNGYQFLAIANAYRHCTELQLKFILRYAIETGDCSFTERQLRTHELDKLWAEVRRILSDTAAGPEETLDDVESVLEELVKADEFGQDLRYPNRTDGSKSLQGVPDDFSIDQFVATMKKIYTFLDCCGGMFQDEYDRLSSSYYGP